jgi:ribose 5-phosphate isomerase RpiB
MDTHGDAVLRWSGRVLAADDLRRALAGQREVILPRETIVTPLAAEELRARGIRVTRLEGAATAPAARWAQAQERPWPLVHNALQAAAREGIGLGELPATAEVSPQKWALAVAQGVDRGPWQGGVVFCGDPGLVCCVANKLPGLRAVPVTTVDQAVQALRNLGANLLAVEMPGRTFFELRQILRLLGGGASHACPPEVARTLQELDGHAHR